ncbi:MAG: hypothetical protein ABSE80_02240 [Halobacteriota archaeon]|jgi:hypothetical protein
MKTTELSKKLRDLGITIPEHRLCRWSREGLITSHETKGRPGKAGRYASWPDDAVEQAAAIYVLRQKNVAWKTSTRALLAAKKIVTRFYEIIEEFCKTEDWQVLEDLYELYEAVESRLFLAGHPTGYMLGGLLRQPAVIKWIATLEKVRRDEPLDTVARVVFCWTQHVVQVDGIESVRLQYNGPVIFSNSADEDMITLHFGFTNEAREKLSGQKPIDWNEANREGAVITLDNDTDWDSVEEDQERQLLIIRDPLFRLVKKVLEGKGIDPTAVKKDSQEWQDAEKLARLMLKGYEGIIFKKADRTEWGAPPWENEGTDFEK